MVPAEFLKNIGVQGLLGQYNRDSQGEMDAMRGYFNDPGMEMPERGRINPTQAILAGLGSFLAGELNHQDNSARLKQAFDQQNQTLDDEFQQKVLKAKEKHAAQRERLKGEMMIAQFKSQRSREQYEQARQEQMKRQAAQDKLAGDPEAQIQTAFQKYLAGEMDEKTFQMLVIALKGRDPYTLAMLQSAQAAKANADAEFVKGPKTGLTEAQAADVESRTKYRDTAQTAESQQRVKVMESVIGVNKSREGLNDANIKKAERWLVEAPARFQADLAQKAANTFKAMRSAQESGGEKPATPDQKRVAINAELKSVKAAIKEATKDFNVTDVSGSVLAIAELQKRQRELEGMLSGLNSAQIGEKPKSKARPSSMGGKIGQQGGVFPKNIRMSQVAEMLGL